ncbi:MAG: DUF1015 domain-containing protein [Phycisphaeraceae bacterium]|nr:DUF1015 domain-containing protein [Phycisphaeraceae bacterium]
MPMIEAIRPYFPGNVTTTPENGCPTSDRCGCTLDITGRIAPPYDVLDDASKSRLLDMDADNIVAVDLPFLPPKTVGPDEVYVTAGERFGRWLESGTLIRHPEPCLLVYVQHYTHGGKSFARKGLIGLVPVQDFGPGPESGVGGVYPHEKTFAAAKEDRLKLMRATRTQLSPIFGLYEDSAGKVEPLLNQAIQGNQPDFCGRSEDGVEHHLFIVEDADWVRAMQDVLRPADIFIADGHHRYTTAIRYRQEVGPGLGADHCMFVLVEMGDPGLVVLPTHRVLGGMRSFSVEQLKEFSAGRFLYRPFGQLDASAPQAERLQMLSKLEQALPECGPHAMGLVALDNGKLQYLLASTPGQDPLADILPEQSVALRTLDVAVLQHLLVENILAPNLAESSDGITWKFPHDPAVLDQLVTSGQYPLGVVMRATPLESVAQISRNGELMPQKSTFFYPKLATGFALHPLD